MITIHLHLAQRQEEPVLFEPAVETSVVVSVRDMFGLFSNKFD